jgi:uncharacterized membrane protein (UPF0127 family)
VARGGATLTLRREDGRIVCERVRVADTMWRRLRGLLGRKNLESDEGMLLRPGFSIHTAFMRFPIDVVFLDTELVVLKIDPGVKPFRTASCRGAREVVELRAGECARRGLAEGDRVTWAPLATDDELVDDIAPVRHGGRGRVLIGSRDPRFVKLTRFLLESREIGVTAAVPLDELAEELAGDPVDVVLLDAADELADGLRTAAGVLADHGDVAVVVAGEGAAERAPGTQRVYDKWEETDELIAAVEEAIGVRDGPANAATA